MSARGFLRMAGPAPTASIEACRGFAILEQELYRGHPSTAPRCGDGGAACVTAMSRSSRRGVRVPSAAGARPPPWVSQPRVERPGWQPVAGVVRSGEALPSIAVIEVSARTGSVGAALLRNVRERFSGPVFAVGHGQSVLDLDGTVVAP